MPALGVQTSSPQLRTLPSNAHCWPHAPAPSTLSGTTGPLSGLEDRTVPGRRMAIRALAPHPAPSFCQTYRAESPVPLSPALRPGAAEGRTSREGHLVLGVQCVPTAKRGMWGSFPGRTVARRWHCPLLPPPPTPSRASLIPKR